MRVLIAILILSSCASGTNENLSETLTLYGAKLNGYWRLVRINPTSPDSDSELNPDKLIHYDFEGLEGIETTMTDYHDGSFGLESCPPFCELKERENKK